MGYLNRWTNDYTRQSTGGLLSLDVRALKRAGALRPGAVHSWRWTRGSDADSPRISAFPTGFDALLTIFP